MNEGMGREKEKNGRQVLGKVRYNVPCFFHPIRLDRPSICPAYVRTRERGGRKAVFENTDETGFPAPTQSFIPLLLSEANRFLDSPCELLCERVVGLVRRQIQTVEARVRLGELRLFARLFDREATGSVGTLKIFEPVDGDTRGTSGELQEAGLLLGVPAANDLWLQ